MALGLLDRPRIFLQLYLNRSGATRAVTLDIFNAFDRIWPDGPLHKRLKMEFQVRYLALYLLFSVIDGFE